ALLVGGIALVVAFLRFPAADPVVPLATTASVPRLALDRDLYEPDREAARELARLAQGSNDAEMKQLAEELRQLFEQLDRRELTRKQLFDKLDELEQRALRGEGGDFEELKRKLRKAGQELGKDALAKETADALKQDQLAAAKQ